MHALCWLLVGLATTVSGARILAVLPFAFKSHHIFHQAILKALALRGHHVTVYSAFPLDRPVPSYVDVFLNSSFTSELATSEMVEELWPVARDLWSFVGSITEEALQLEAFQKLIHSKKKFDLVITETFFAQEAFLVLGHVFNAPTITFQPFGSFGLINRVMGNSLSLPFIPDVQPFTDHMTFYERLVNSFAVLSSQFLLYYQHIPDQQTMLDRHLKLRNAPPLADLVRNISLVFVNAHPTIHYPQPLTPNIIPIGGIHLLADQIPLPKNIQKFMDEATNGVIYFSFGSFVPDHEMLTEYFRNFVNVFRKLPQRVLWKTKSQIPDLPNNVMTATWMPQQSVLAHPNCVLFMTHGGLLSLLETVWAGVPVVGTPFYADQPMNVRYYEHTGIGVRLDFSDLSEHTISRAITTVLSNSSYRENAQRLSRVFRDLPMSSADSAVFWVEYVLRHRGAGHLQPASASSPGTSSLCWMF